MDSRKGITVHAKMMREKRFGVAWICDSQLLGGGNAAVLQAVKYLFDHIHVMFPILA